MKAYSQDLRERVVDAADLGDETHEEIAERFSVSTAWIRRLLQRRRETGTFAALPHGGGMPAKFSGAALERLQQAMSAEPDATLAELRQRTRVKASIMAVDRALRRLGVHRKKVAPRRGAGPARCRRETARMVETDYRH